VKINDSKKQKIREKERRSYNNTCQHSAIRQEQYSAYYSLQWLIITKTPFVYKLNYIEKIKFKCSIELCPCA